MDKITNKNSEKRKHKKRYLIVLIAIVVSILISYISYRGVYLETLDIGEQYLSVISQNYHYKYVTLAINFAVIFLAIYITTRLIKRGLKTFFNEEKKEMPKLPNKSIAFIMGIIISMISSGFLLKNIMLIFNTAWFGINDPVFNIDIGYYFFQEPFIRLLIIYAIVLMIGLTAYIAIYYIVVFNLYFDGINSQTLKKNTFIKHLTVNAMIIVVLIGLLIILNTQTISRDTFLTLNNTNSTRIVGAGVTDVTIKAWGYRLLAVIVVISMFSAIKAFKLRDTKKVIKSVVVVPAYLVALFLIMTVYQLIFINSNELDKQKDYISKNIEYTQKAYGIKIDEKQVENSGTITYSQIQENQSVIENIPIVSSEITAKTLNNLQTSTGYYSFREQLVSKYEMNGKDTLVYISPREINNSGKSYNNKTFEYTHGFGAIINSAITTMEDGNLEYILKDFDTEKSEISITQPRIYYGLNTNNTIVTNTNNKAEFDYPKSSTTNAEFNYNGKSGLNVSFIDKLILAIKEKDINLAFLSNVNEDSKILINRNIIKRAEKIMPYLLYDENPYMVIDDNGNLLWVIDAYTVANEYPYAQSISIEYKNSKKQINYIRNSVKVIVNAYDGTMDFYITDKTDPIIMAYNNIYKNVFKNEEDIPQDIAKHFIYPKFLYNIQAQVLQMYHNVGADVLYRGDDEWEIARYAMSGTKGTKIQPYYTMLKTNDSSKEIFGLMLPYTPVNKQNINAYLIGNVEGTDNKLTLYKFSSGNNIIGTMQLDKQIEQDETIAKEIANINVSGTKLIKNMLVIPVENTLLYVEPIYQQTLNEANSIPLLKKVIVASGNKVAIGDSLKDALNNLLLSQHTSNIEVEDTTTVEGLVDAIIKANNNLNESSNITDWEQMGKDLNKLQNLIAELEKIKKNEEKETKEDNTVNENLNIIN